jgi:hypothetical protein
LKKELIEPQELADFSGDIALAVANPAATLEAYN